MSLKAIFSELAVPPDSPEFLLTARHPEHPTAFSRDRKLPLACLVAVMLCGMRVEKSGDAGFASVRDFLRSGLAEKVVALRAPNKRDAKDYGCTRVPQTVRLGSVTPPPMARHVS